MKKILLALAVAVTIQAGDLSDGMEALERGDFKAAVVFFEKAANEGNKMAQQNLSVMYSNGYGVKKDKQIASMWLNRATNQSAVALR
jgi:TPR repeat protein